MGSPEGSHCQKMQHTGSCPVEGKGFHDNWKQQVDHHGLPMQRRRLMLSGSHVHCQRPVKLRSRNIRYMNEIIPITHRSIVDD